MKAQVIYWTLYGLVFVSILVYVYSYFVPYATIDSSESFTTSEQQPTKNTEKILMCKLAPKKSENAFQMIWNGFYTYSQTQPNNKSRDNFLQIAMKDDNSGIVTVKDNHWLVKSYGPTVLSGNSPVDNSAINIEYIGDWRKCCETEPKIKVVTTNPKTGTRSSLSTSDPRNLDGVSVKVVTV